MTHTPRPLTPDAAQRHLIEIIDENADLTDFTDPADLLDLVLADVVLEPDLIAAIRRRGIYTQIMAAFAAWQERSSLTSTLTALEPQ